MEKILVAVDGSDNSDRALMRARTLGTPFNSNITILNIIEDHAHLGIFAMDNFTEHDQLLQKELKESSVNLLNSYMESFKDYSGKVDTLIKSGKPANIITEFGEEEGYDLIIIGSRGLGPFPGQMIGSVSNKVVNNSRVNVLTVQ